MAIRFLPPVNRGGRGLFLGSPIPSTNWSASADREERSLPGLLARWTKFERCPCQKLCALGGQGRVLLLKVVDQRQCTFCVSFSHAHFFVHLGFLFLCTTAGLIDYRGTPKSNYCAHWTANLYLFALHNCHSRKLEVRLRILKQIVQCLYN